MAQKRASTSELQGNLYKVSKGSILGISSRKVFAVCDGTSLSVWRTEHERIKGELPIKHVPVEPHTRVEDTGLQRITERKQLYTFALHYSSSEGQQKKLVLGSKDPEVTATWRSELGRIRALLLASAGMQNTPSAEPHESTSEASEHHQVQSDTESIPNKFTKRRYDRYFQFHVAHYGIGAVNSINYHAHLLRSARSGKLPSDLVPFSETVDNVLKHTKRSNEMTPSAEPTHDAEAGGDERPSVVPESGSNGTDWRIVHLANGVRVFEETGRECHGSTPAMKAISKVKAPADVIFRLVMDLATSRSEWDATFEQGKVVEAIDGHTDVVNFRTGSTRAFPLTFAPRDFCFIRNWRREEDGTYVVLYRSTTHPNCPPPEGTVRGNLLGGGYIITPLDSAKTDSDRTAEASASSLVTHLIELAPDSFMMKHVAPCFGAERALHLKLLLRVAGIRDFFDQVSGFGLRDIVSLPAPDEDEDEDADVYDYEVEQYRRGMAHEHHDSDEQFIQAEDRLPPSEDSDDGPPKHSANSSDVRFSGDLADDADATSERKWQSSHADGVSEDLQKTCNGQEPKLHISESEIRRFADLSSLRPGHWPEKKGEPSVHAWCEVNDPKQFMVRSRTYLRDKVKVQAGSPMGRLVATDWFVDNERIDNVCSRPGGIAHDHLIPYARENNEFLFCMNIQVPGASPYSIVFYFLLPKEYAENKRYLLARTLHEDDSFKDAHFKLIPSVTKGAWVVKRSVGTKPVIVGGALKVRYHQGNNFLECDVDVGSSSVASSAVWLVLNTLRTLVIDLALLVEAKTEEDLPEKLIGTLRVTHVDPDAAVRAPPPAHGEKGDADEQHEDVSMPDRAEETDEGRL